MLDRLFSLFQGNEAENGLSANDPRVAAAALMYHVMDADGERREEERAVLRKMVADTYGLSGDALADVLKAGEQADREAVDLYAFTSVIKRELDEPARNTFIEILWEVVFADGLMHELEDNTVWRIAELIGVSGRERVLLRSEVAGRHGVSLTG
ncbi:MAG: TerB family tellurite resistance protein [Notoacmeibacter sp.]|nr:TerB family tellurite resistance protein [Notoacmeibacter sp.]